MVLSIVTFICSVIPHWSGYGGGWVSFVSMSAFFSVLVIFIFFLLNIHQRLHPVSYLIELIIYAVFTVFYLIAAIVCAARASWHGAIAAAAFFAFAATAVFAVDTFLQFKAWRSGENEMATTTTTTTTTTTNAEAGKQVY
jgi:glucan phosphoethanolaminetransferase (alkaline phosphatase superfamily)